MQVYIRRVLMLLLVIFLIGNAIYSFYNWAIYAYNAKTSAFTITAYEETVKKDDSFNAVHVKLLEQWRTTHSVWNINKDEWLVILLGNVAVLILVLIMARKRMITDK